MKQLIINADDFGLHKNINLGIIAGHKAGGIKSTTIMAGAEAFNDAVQQTKECSTIDVGIHFTLVASRPVLDASIVPTLITKDGTFENNYLLFIKKYFLGQISKIEIRAELTAQLQRALEAGLHITHIDSHQHLHVLPGIIDIVLDIGKKYNVNKIRIPDEPMWFRGSFPFQPIRYGSRGGLTLLARLARKKAKTRGFMMPDHFFGMLAGGSMTEKYLMHIVNDLPEGVSEIMMHPGMDQNSVLRDKFTWQYHWNEELSAVTSDALKLVLEKKHIELISYESLLRE